MKEFLNYVKIHEKFKVGEEVYKGKKFVAIIPARGGSKEIPNKNIVDLNGRPLIDYSIKAGKESKYIDYVYVSTDNEKIKNIALNCGAEVPFLRDASLATDTAKTIDAMIFSIKKLSEIGLNFDYLVILQPTSPLRTAKEIDEAIEKLLSSSYDSLVSVSKSHDNPILMRTIDENDCLVPLLNQSSTVRRQDFKEYYRVNGAIYINEIKNLSNDTSLNDNKLSYIMPEELSIDIDTMEDLNNLRQSLNRN